MSQLLQFKQDRAALIEGALTIAKLAETEKRGFTDAELADINERTTKAEGLERSIKSLETLGAAASNLQTDAPAVRQAAQVHDNKGDAPFATRGEFLQCVRAAALNPHNIDPRLMTRAASGLNESVGSEGGFFVTKDMEAELLKRVYETGAVVSRVRRIQISANSNGTKINGVDETSRANGSRWGGVQAYWQNEADAATATKPKFRQIELNLHKLVGLCYATDEMLQDSSVLESVINQAFTEEFAFKLDDAAIRGAGAGMPLGILSSPSLVTVAKEAGQTTNTFKFENVQNMWSRMWARSRQNAIWFINQDVEPQLNAMSLAVGTAGVPVYLPANGLSGSPYSTLMGRPVIAIEQCESLSTVGDVILADFSQYVMIDKGNMQSASSIHVRFLNDEQVFRFIYRADGQPTWNSALTPYKGSSTKSPFVVLASR